MKLEGWVELQAFLGPYQQSAVERIVDLYTELWGLSLEEICFVSTHPNSKPAPYQFSTYTQWAYYITSDGRGIDWWLIPKRIPPKYILKRLAGE